MLRKALLCMAAMLLGFGTVAALAAPTGPLSKIPQEDQWQDLHYGYPVRPYGLSAIKKTFGAPCSRDANTLTYIFFAGDNGKAYPVNFHRLLGGVDSSNLDNDIPFHIEKKNLESKVLSGIWGFNCRVKRGSSDYSAHAWGIAVDINSAYESPGQTCRTISAALGQIWTDHNWYWGAVWKDCMHFQYATGY